MAKTVPVVYILHGEDEFGIVQFVDKIKEKLGDASLAETNTTHLDGRALSLEELQATAYAIPFLTTRRLVIVNNPLNRLKTEPLQARFQRLIEGLPTSTALLLVMAKSLNERHWLVKWAKNNPKLVFIRPFPILKGGQLANWLRTHAAKQGGEITPQAASLLAETFNEDPRGVVQELEKLLTYVNYKRAVDVDDVDNLSAFASGQGDYFAMIDAIGRGDGRKALDMLKSLLDEQEPLALYFRLVSNFRMLLLTREILDDGGDEKTVAKTLEMHPYRAKKLSGQARNLSLAILEAIYRRLLVLDEQIKTGRIDASLALETLIATLTSSPV
ncbi:MAG: DNA polymerase III subunit delta [Chloroflexi bacterium]|nr:DNA polymerase III subunit delta [Chloroflexota bacterium]